MRPFSYTLKDEGPLQGKDTCYCLLWILNHWPFFMDIIFYLKKMTDRDTMVIHTWVFGRNFLNNEKSEPITSKTTTDSTYFP